MWDFVASLMVPAKANWTSTIAAHLLPNPHSPFSPPRETAAHPLLPRPPLATTSSLIVLFLLWLVFTSPLLTLASLFFLGWTIFFASMPGTNDNIDACTCADCPVHGVMVSGLQDHSFETDMFPDSEDAAPAGSITDASDRENVPPSLPYSHPMSPCSIALAESRARAQARAQAQHSSSASTSSYQSSTVPRSQNEVCVIFMRPNFDEVPPPPSPKPAPTSSPNKRPIGTSSASIAEPIAPPTHEHMAKAKRPAVTAKASASAPVSSPLMPQSPPPASRAHQDFGSSITHKGKGNAVPPPRPAPAPQPSRSSPAPATQASRPSARISTAMASSEGLRAINILGVQELAEGDPIPDHVRKNPGPFYIIEKGMDLAVSMSYFSGVFNNTSFTHATTKGIHNHGLRLLSKNVAVAWSLWLQKNQDGSIHNPVHPDSVFPRIISAAELSERLAALDNNTNDDDDMYASDHEQYLSETDFDAGPAQSSSPIPVEQPMDEATEPLWEYFVTSLTEWDLDLSDIAVWVVTRGLMPGKYYNKTDFLEGLGTHWRAEGYLFTSKLRCRQWSMQCATEYEGLR